MRLDYERLSANTLYRLFTFSYHYYSPHSDIEMEDLPSQLLSVLDTSDLPFRSDEVAAILKIDHQKVVGAVKSLQNQEGVIILWL